MFKNLFGLNKEYCAVCGKQVFINEKMTYDSKVYHNQCFRCKKCNVKINPSTMGKLGENFYCYTHMIEEFKLRGNYEGTNNEKETERTFTKTPVIEITTTDKKKKEKSKSLSQVELESTKEWLIIDKIPLNSKFIIEKNENGKVIVSQFDPNVFTDSEGNSPEEVILEKPRKRFGTIAVNRKKSAPRLLELEIEEKDEKLEDITPKGSPKLRKNFLKVTDSPKTEVLRKSSVSTETTPKQERRLSTSGDKLFFKKEPLKNRIFGVEYEILMEKETEKCPKIVIELIDYLLQEKASEVEGIFRVSGTQGDIDDILFQIDKGKDIEWKSIKDIHTISSLLKLYFRSLPSPLLTFELYNDFLKINAVESDDEKVDHIKKTLLLLSPSRRYCLGILMNLLNIIQKNSKVNMMNSNNLSVIFSMNLLREKEEDSSPMSVIISQQRVSKAFEDMLILYDNYKTIFVEEEIKN